MSNKKLVLKTVANKPDSYMLIELIMKIDVNGKPVNLYGPASVTKNISVEKEVAASSSQDKEPTIRTSNFF